MNKVFTSAVIIMPPEDQWDQIQAVRKVHDKAFVRWMPHINMLYPFVDEACYRKEKLTNKLMKALSSVEPFDISLSSFDSFTHSGKNGTMFLHSKKNNDLIVKVQAALERAVPECNDLSRGNQFKPHLTLGQIPHGKKMEAKLNSLASSWKPIQCKVDRLYVIRRSGNDPFKVVEEIFLGQETKEETSNSSVDKLEAIISDLSIEDKSNPTVTIVKRVTDWIQEQQRQKQNLPRTKEKLSRAIARMCCFPSSFTANHIITALEEEGYMVVKESTVNVAFKKFSGLRLDNFRAYEENKSSITNMGSYYAPPTYGDEKLELKTPSKAEQETMGFDRTIRWLATQIKLSRDNHVFQKASLLSQIRQLCEFKVYVSPFDVVEYFQKSSIFSFSEDYETIIYN